MNIFLNIEIFHNFIFEEYHIVNTFYNCARDIIRNISKFEHVKFKFSDWIFDYKNKHCVNLRLFNNA